MFNKLYQNYIRKSDDSNPSNFDDFFIIRPDRETAVNSGSSIKQNYK